MGVTIDPKSKLTLSPRRGHRKVVERGKVVLLHGALKVERGGGSKGEEFEENEPNKKGVSKPSIARRGPKDTHQPVVVGPFLALKGQLIDFEGCFRFDSCLKYNPGESCPFDPTIFFE